MVNSYTKSEADRRRFDIGSGIPLEPLDAKTLQFIFHPRVKRRILGYLGDYNSLAKSEGEVDRIYWNEDIGTALRGNTTEILFLGATSADKVAINKVLSASSNVDGLIGIISSPDAEKTSINYEVASARIEQIVNKLGGLITLAVAHGFESIEAFRKEIIGDEEDHPYSRLMAMNTSGRNQARVLAFKHTSRQQNQPFPDSHPIMVPVSSAATVDENKEKGPFKKQKTLRSILFK